MTDPYDITMPKPAIMREDETTELWAELMGELKSYLNTRDWSPAVASDVMRRALAAHPLDACRNAFKLIELALNAEDHGFNFDESWEGHKLPARVMAHLIMQVLPGGGDSKPMTLADKTYWLEVAEHLGPDWYAEVKHAGDFMTRAYGFDR